MWTYLGDNTRVSSAANLTEWETSREREEFMRASQLYRPITGVMASRFTTAQYEDGNESLEVALAKAQNQKVPQIMHLRHCIVWMLFVNVKALVFCTMYCLYSRDLFFMHD